MTRCSHCFVQSPPDVKFKACASCKAEYYCGRECQVAAWRAGHKQECAQAQQRRQHAIDVIPGGKREMKAIHKSSEAYIEANRPNLMYLAHKQLLGKHETHLALVQAAYSPDQQPVIRIDNISTMSKRQMREQHPDSVPMLDQANADIRAMDQQRGFSLPTALIIFDIPVLQDGHTFTFHQTLPLGTLPDVSAALLAHLASPRALSVSRVSQLLNSGDVREVNGLLMEVMTPLISSMSSTMGPAQITSLLQALSAQLRQGP